MRADGPILLLLSSLLGLASGFVQRRKIIVAGGAELPTVRLGQVPCMGRRVNSARTGR